MPSSEQREESKYSLFYEICEKSQIFCFRHENTTSFDKLPVIYCVQRDRSYRNTIERRAEYVEQKKTLRHFSTARVEYD